MEGGTGTLNNQGPTQPSNKSDLTVSNYGIQPTNDSARQLDWKYYTTA
jgi:hypothetical protein